MKIKIKKPIRVTEVGKDVLPAKHECEVSKNVGKVLIKKGYAKEVVDVDRPNAKNTIKAIKDVTDIKDLAQYEKDEDRSTVIDAIEAKKTELQEGSK